MSACSSYCSVRIALTLDGAHETPARITSIRKASHTDFEGRSFMARSSGRDDHDDAPFCRTPVAIVDFNLQGILPDGTTGRSRRSGPRHMGAVTDTETM
jgi:hypothetical protein